MGKIENYASLDETIRCEFEELWNSGIAFVNEEDVTQITGLVKERGIASGYDLLSFNLDNGLFRMMIVDLGLWDCI